MRPLPGPDSCEIQLRLWHLSSSICIARRLLANRLNRSLRALALGQEKMMGLRTRSSGPPRQSGYLFHQCGGLRLLLGQPVASSDSCMVMPSTIRTRRRRGPGHRSMTIFRTRSPVCRSLSRMKSRNRAAKLDHPLVAEPRLRARVRLQKLALELVAGRRVVEEEPELDVAGQEQGEVHAVRADAIETSPRRSSRRRSCGARGHEARHRRRLCHAP